MTSDVLRIIINWSFDVKFSIGTFFDAKFSSGTFFDAKFSIGTFFDAKFSFGTFSTQILSKLLSMFCNVYTLIMYIISHYFIACVYILYSIHIVIVAFRVIETIKFWIFESCSTSTTYPRRRPVLWTSRPQS